MKAKNTKRSAPTPPKKGMVNNIAKGLTNLAGLLSVIRFLQFGRMPETTRDTIKYIRWNIAELNQRWFQNLFSGSVSIFA